MTCSAMMDHPFNDGGYEYAQYCIEPNGRYRCMRCRCHHPDPQLAAANATISARDAEVERFRENYRCAYEERAEYRKEVNWLKDRLAEARAALDRVADQVEYVSRDQLIPLDAISNIEDIVGAFLARTPEAGRGHMYEGACRNVQHADSKCTCGHIANGRRCGQSRYAPIHQQASQPEQPQEGQ